MLQSRAVQIAGQARHPCDQRWKIWAKPSWTQGNLGVNLTMGKPWENRDYHWLFHGNIMEYRDEKWHFNQFLGQSTGWVETNPN